MVEQDFDNIESILRRESWCTTDLKYLESLATDLATTAELQRGKYTPILHQTFVVAR